MEIKDNFSIFNLFLDKKVKIQIDSKKIYMRVPTILEFFRNEDLNAVYHIWTLSSSERQKMVPVVCDTSFDFLNIILFQMGIYKEYAEITLKFKEILVFLLPEIEINYRNKQLIVDGLIITEEI